MVQERNFSSRALATSVLSLAKLPTPFSVKHTICAILVEAIMRNNSVKFFEVEPVVQEEISLKDMSYQELWQSLCSVEWNHLSNFVRRHHEEQL